MAGSETTVCVKYMRVIFSRQGPKIRTTEVENFVSQNTKLCQIRDLVTS